MDSIVADLQTPWFDKYNQDYDDNLQPSDILTWDVHKYVKPECGEKIYHYFRPDLFRNLAPIENSVASLRRLCEGGHHVYFLTSPPRGCADAKYAWAEEYFPFIKGTIMAKDKFLVQGDVFIDDAPHNVREWYRHNRESHILTIAYPYNKIAGALTNLRLPCEVAWPGFGVYIRKIARCS